MAPLTWRNVSTLHLTTDLIPDPNAGHIKLAKLSNVRVAIEAGFLHIDPRQPRDVEAANGEYEVHIVPASAVQSIVYRDKASAATAPWVAHG